MSGYWYFVFSYWYLISGFWIWDMGIGSRNKAGLRANRPKGTGAHDYLWTGKMITKKENILIVDDELDMCWALARILDRMDFCVQKAFNGEQALQLVAETHFPMAFLDAKLPDIDGLDLAEQIRQKDAGVRIFIVSGYYYQNDKEVQRSLAQGLIIGFIAKPFDHDEIRKAIRDCLSEVPETIGASRSAGCRK
jgi:DNA-binding NtrC family response regulator